MDHHITTKVIKRARKDHDCHACLHLTEGNPDVGFEYNGMFTFSEWRAIAEAKAAGWKIRKGESYERHISEFDGAISNFPCRPDINKIMIKYGLYPDY